MDVREARLILALLGATLEKEKGKERKGKERKGNEQKVKERNGRRGEWKGTVSKRTETKGRGREREREEGCGLHSVA